MDSRLIRIIDEKNTHQTINCLLVHWAIKQSPKEGLTYEQVRERLSNSRWFEGKYAEEILPALDKLRDSSHALLKKEGASYTLIN